MSKFYKKALNKLSSGSGSERSSDSESTDKPDKPRRSLSFKRRSRDQDKSKSHSRSKSLNSSRSSIDSGRRKKSLEDPRNKLKIPEEPQEPTVFPVDVSVRIVDDESEPQASSSAKTPAEQGELSQAQESVPTAIASETDSVDTHPQAQNMHSAATSHLQDTHKSDESTEDTKNDTTKPDEQRNETSSASPPEEQQHENPYRNTAITEEIVEELEPLLRAYSSQGELHDENVEVSPSLVWSVLLALKALFTYLNPKYPKWIHVFLLILILLSILLYFLITNLDSLLAQAVEVNLESVSILRINEDGVDSHIIGSIFVNYDNIPNLIYKSTLKVGAVFLGTLTFVPNRQIEVYVKPAALDIAPLHLVDVFAPPLTIQVINKRETDIDFISKLSIIHEDAVKLSHEFDKLKKIEGDSIKFDIQGVLSSEVQSKYLNFNTDEINVYETIDVPKEVIDPPIEVKEFEMLTTNEVEIYTQIAIERDIPLSLNVNGINWDVLLEDCDGNWLEFGTWKSRQFEIYPNEEIFIEVDGQIKEINEALSYPCNDGTDSPLNKIIQNYLSENPIRFVLRGAKHQDEALPGWMYGILTNLNYEIDVTLPKGSLEVGEAKINSIDFEVPPSFKATEDKVRMFMKSNLSVSLSYDYEIQFQAPKFKSNFTLKDINNIAVIEGYSYNFNYLDINYGENGTANLEVSLETMDIEVVNPERAGDFLNQFFEDGLTVPYDQFYMDLEVNELMFESNIFSSQLNKLKVFNISLSKRHGKVSSSKLESSDKFVNQGIELANAIALSGDESPNEEEDGETHPIDSFLSTLNVSVLSLLYENSHTDGIVLSCDFELTNPTRISLDFPGELLEVDLDYNGTSFGSVRFKDLYIPQDERFSLTGEIVISTNGVDDKIRLEEFLGAYISGYEDLEVNAFNLTARNTGLNTILQKIKVSGIRVPNIQFSGPVSTEPTALGHSTEIVTSVAKGLPVLLQGRLLQSSHSDTAMEIVRISDWFSTTEGSSRPTHPSAFLKEAVIHVFGSDVQLKLLNPVDNAELLIDVYQAEATYDDKVLGYLQKAELLVVTPGVYQTPRIPIKVSQGIGMDILKKAINGELQVGVMAIFKVRLDKFEAELVYRGHGVHSQIRL